MIDRPADPSEAKSLPKAQRSEPRSGVRAAPLTLWLGIQLLSLSLSAARVPLWARAGEPVEQFAAMQMTTLQVISAALLFGWLMRNLTTAAAVILTSIPMLLLAGMLAETPPAHLMGAAAVVCAWLVILGIWSAALRTEPSRLIGMALATLWALGVPVARYIVADFHHAAPPHSPRTWAMPDPATAAVMQLKSSAWDAPMWVMLGISGAVGATAWAVRPRTRRATTYPQP